MKIDVNADALHPLLARLRGAGDAVFALAVLGVVLLLVTPLPPALLDALLALNLATAATILVVTLFAREALRFASFPTLLLLTTLFRLALNVSSTRLVLSRGDAGRVIEAFGRVVVQGDYVVGAVVFAILTLVQLLVVAKGAERVAEVAARFTLDAMPGKQMAIDADLRAGAIEQGEARRRRRALERESQLYGAMDGALKFVKGDAIAGIAIVLVNVTGGLVAGVLRGMDAGQAARRYALLAIGDGLVSQIPALLVAVSAGVAVTRVAAEEEGASLPAEIGRQLLAHPAALGAVAALLGGLALAPGLPAAPFLLLAAAAGGTAHRLSRQRAPRAAAAGVDAPAATPAASDDPLAPAAPLVIELADDLFASARQGGFVTEGLAGLRDALWRDLGIRLPGVAVRPMASAPGTWRVLVDEVPAGGGRAPAAEAVVLASADELALVGIASVPEADPVTGRKLCLIAAADAARAAALAPVRGPLDRVLAGTAGALARSAAELVGVQEVQVLLDGLEPAAPALVREVTRQLPAPLLAEVLRRLVQEGVSIRPLRTILEALLEAGGAARGASALAEAARRALRRHLARVHAGDGPLAVLLLDPSAEQTLREALSGEALALDPDVGTALLDAVGAELDGCSDAPVLLVSPDVRRPLRGLVAARWPHVAVLTYEELPPELAVRPLGRIAIAKGCGEGEVPRGVERDAREVARLAARS
ncbi:flagellar biosynthesis protein FlhA [Anaeromyxobacter oryzae]|uniref:EscV/YscV/HrcV family type III secretion system export apparatus protein n=1 Tax=Anaeromyxobacter oryzae TaxID=2918170 RepID=A0ABM7WY15_9BACT|nr:flagellar biosynthesis protein FlhA [Anaeromyxobacter oryzae]BDG04357.1 EscV/YscV/HrcV family type III secretion system export apparatus protein [Anaeromyxobacter oryzae]